jgi:hypothetical protein
VLDLYHYFSKTWTTISSPFPGRYLLGRSISLFVFCIAFIFFASVFFFAATASTEDRAYFIGGYDGAFYEDVFVWMENALGNPWLSFRMSQKRREFAAIRIPGTQTILAAGGYHIPNTLATVDFISTGRCSFSLPSSARRFCSMFLFLFCFGSQQVIA